jgi:hypothetical protein
MLYQILNAHPTTQYHARVNCDKITEMTIVIDGSRCVDDTKVAQHDVCIEDRVDTDEIATA